MSTSQPPQNLQTQVVTAGRDAISRAVRQAIQALIPTLLVVAGGSTVGINIEAVATLAGVTVLMSVLKSAAGLKLGADQPPWARIVERALTAAAGTALGLVTVDGMVPAAEIRWEPLWIASAGSAALAVAMFWTNPPVVAAPVVPDNPYLGDGGSTYQDPTRPLPDRGDVDVLTVIAIFVLIGIVLLLLGVTFR